MALIMVIKGKFTKEHEDVIGAFQELDMLLGLGYDRVTEQRFIAIKRVGDFAYYYLDPPDELQHERPKSPSGKLQHQRPKSPSDKLQHELGELVKKQQLVLTHVLKVTV